MIDEVRRRGLTRASLSSCPIPKTNIPSKNRIFDKRYFSMQNLPIGEQNFEVIRHVLGCPNLDAEIGLNQFFLKDALLSV